jgi:hypothetical protein
MVAPARQSTFLIHSMSNSPLRDARRAAVGRCALVAILFGHALSAWAVELRGTKDYAEAAAAVETYIDQYGAEHVLLASDIDNTVMAMDGDLGSDHWFEWQHYLLVNEPDSRHLVAKDFPGLLKVQGLLFHRNHMHPPQADLPQIIARLQQRGVATILLTSRGPEFRDDTARELKRCGYDFAATALPVRSSTGEYLPFDPADPEKDGLKAEEITRYKLPPPRPVSYADGVFMTAGQHKGIMLLTLLHDSPREIKAVVYIDDNVRHVGSVFTALVGRQLDISSFQYQHEDLRVQRFQYSDKHEVDEAWARIRREMAAPAPVAVSVADPQRCVVKRAPCRRRRLLHH